MNPLSYTSVPTDPVILELAACHDRGELFRLLREQFGLAADCGENWDAVWDGLTDVCLRDREQLILVTGLDAVPEALRRDAWLLRRVLDDLQEECPLVRVEYC